MLYQLKSIERETRVYFYEIKAKNRKDAEEMIRSGDAIPIDHKFIDGEIERIEEDK